MSSNNTQNPSGDSGTSSSGHSSSMTAVVEAGPQRRQPQNNLQGVLRYSIQASEPSNAHAASGSTSVQPMDEERRRFLEATLRAMTDNPVEHIANCIEVLSHNGNDVATSLDALEEISDLVDNIDNAMDFHKIGGFNILTSLLASPEAAIRSKTASLIAIMSQNNPYVQSQVLKTDLMDRLLDLMSDPDTNVQVSSLYAISCIVRGSDECVKRFAELNGWTVLLKAMTSSVEKLQLKSAFFLASLCSLYPDIIADLCNLRFVERLCGLLSVSQVPLLEHVLRALVTMAANNKQAASICLEAQLQLDTSLANVLQTMESDSDEYLYAQQLKSAVFGASVEDDGER